MKIYQIQREAPFEAWSAISSYEDIFDKRTIIDR